MSDANVSVIIASYNAKDFIGRAIDSALNQTMAPHEVIVVDDCSRDGTREALQARAAREPRLKILALAENGGPSAARNAGIEAAQGDWVAILDADDAFMPERLAALVPFAIERGLDFVADDLAYYDAGAAAVVGHGLGEMAPIEVSLHTFLAHNLADGAGMDWGLLKPVFRRAALRQYGINYDPAVRHGEDFQLVVALLLAGARFGILPEPLYLYTQRLGAKSQRASGLTRTNVAYGKLREAALALARTPRIAADPELVRLLTLRARGLGRQDDAHYISTALRRGAYLGLARKIATESGFLQLMCAQLGRAVRRRLHAAR